MTSWLLLNPNLGRDSVRTDVQTYRRTDAQKQTDAHTDRQERSGDVTLMKRTLKPKRPGDDSFDQLINPFTRSEVALRVLASNVSVTRGHTQMRQTRTDRRWHKDQRGTLSCSRFGVSRFGYRSYLPQRCTGCPAETPV